MILEETNNRSSQAFLSAVVLPHNILLYLFTLSYELLHYTGEEDTVDSLTGWQGCELDGLAVSYKQNRHMGGANCAAAQGLAPLGPA